MTTELEEVRVDVASLAIGMFVSRLDRPWEGTPFLLQGFELRTEQELATLRGLCKFVYIDRRREIDTHQRRRRVRLR